MNGFFSFSELGKNEFPLKELAKDISAKELSLSQLDKSLAKEVPSRMEAPYNIDGMQRAAIKEGFNRIANGEHLSNIEKGNLAEMKMDQYFKSRGYTPIHSPRITSLDYPGHPGIDGVYKCGDHYVIADAKCDSARLKETQDGTQMSWNWIDRRLDAAVGKPKAEAIRKAYEDGSVHAQVYHLYTYPDGGYTAKIYSVNDSGRMVP